MTAEEEFEKWWAETHQDLLHRGIRYDSCKAAYLAATKATAARCVEICEEWGALRSAAAIKRDYGLE